MLFTGFLKSQCLVVKELRELGNYQTKNVVGDTFIVIIFKNEKNQIYL